MTLNNLSAARSCAEEVAVGSSKMPKALGAAVKLLRSELKLTQTQLAEKLAVIVKGVNQSYISQLENGELYPGSERLSALLSVLGCSAQDLWSIAEEFANGDLDDQSRKGLLELLEHDEFGFSYEQRVNFDRGSDPVIQKRFDEILDRVSFRTCPGGHVSKEDLAAFIEVAKLVPMPPVFLKLVRVLHDYIDTYGCASVG